MFVGHFAVAFLLWRLFPQVPLSVILIAVSFPDLLWSILVPAGVETVRINPDSPLQKFVVFEKFPYSHSLVLGSIISLPIGLLIAAILNNPLVVPVFVAGSASHWLLDTVVHLKDLPSSGIRWRPESRSWTVEERSTRIRRRICPLRDRHSVRSIRIFVSIRVDFRRSLSRNQSAIVLWGKQKEQRQILQLLRSASTDRIRIVHGNSCTSHLTKSHYVSSGKTELALIGRKERNRKMDHLS